MKQVGVGSIAKLSKDFNIKFERPKLKNQFRFIDAHCHVWPQSVDEFKTSTAIMPNDRIPNDYSIEAHINRLESIPIKATVIVPHIAYYGRQIDYALWCAKQYPGDCAVMGAITKNEIENPQILLDDISNGVRSFRIRGIDLIRPIDAMCEFLISSSCVLCPLLTPQQSKDGGLIRVAELAKKYTNLLFILDHFGGDCCVDSLRKFTQFPNVAIKISDFGSFDFPPYDHAAAVTVELSKIFGADRLMWGSNNPVFEIDSQQNLTQAFRAIQHAEELSEYDKKLILGGTAERIFFL